MIETGRGPAAAEGRAQEEFLRVERVPTKVSKTSDPERTEWQDSHMRT